RAIVAYRLECARSCVLHMLKLGRNDDAVVVTAVAWPDANQLICFCIDEGNAADKPLETAKDADHILTIICNSQGLHVRSDPLDLLFNRPGLGVDNHDPARRRGGMKDRQIEF